MSDVRSLVEQMRGNRTKLAIFNTVRQLGRTTALDVEFRIGLSRPTVLKYLEQLADDGLVIEHGEGEPSGGRPSRVFEIRSSAAFSVGVDFGAPGLTFALVDVSKGVIDKMEVETDLEEPPSLTAKRMEDGIRQITLRNEVELEERVIAVAVGVPCHIERETELLQPIPRLPHWENVPLKAVLERELEVPVYVETGPRLMVIGEREFGGGGDVRNMVYIHVREGIDMGVIVDGRVLKGSKEDVGGIGHTVVWPQGPVCICGRRGCLEVFASEPAMVRRMEEMTGRRIGPHQLFSEVRDGVPEARKVIEEAMYYLAIAIVNVVELFDPEVVVVGGNIVQGGEFVLRTLREKLEGMKLDHRGVEVRFSSLGVYAGALGAASFAMESAFNPFPEASA